MKAIGKSAAVASLLWATFSASNMAMAAAACDRNCLTGMAEKYLVALAAHDPAKAPMLKGTRYTENAVQLTMPDGLWRTATSIGAYRLFVVDEREGSIGFFVKALENGAPALVSTRLRVAGGKITEVESLVSRQSDTLGGTPANLRDDKLGDAPRPQFLHEIPVAQRLPRDKLASIANSYFTGLENNFGDEVPPFADDCYRLENGTPTTGRPVAEGASPGAMNYGCREAFSLGYYREDTRLRSRRILAIDELHGLVMAGVAFDHDAAIRNYQLKDGRPITVRNTAPWTWMIHEIFQITPEGKISQVEAILLSVPYGMRPGWPAPKQTFESPQAIKDGYVEYPTGH
jgi:hypothetical protein